MKSLRKIIAGMTAAVMLAGSVHTVFAAPNIASVSFDDGKYTNHGGEIVDGFKGNAISLSGTDSYVEFDASAVNKMSGDFTVSVFCRPESTKTWARIFDIGNGEGSYIFLAQSTSYHVGLPRFVIKPEGGAEQIIDASVGLDINEWNNITVTRSGNTTSIYINGYLSGTTESMLYNFSDVGKTANNYIGRSQFKADPYFNGDIDEVVFSGSAMSEEEIIALAGDSYQRQIRKQEEAERKAKEKLIEDNNRLIIDTDFYDGETGEKLMQLEGNKSVRAEITVKNLKKGDASVGFFVNDKSEDAVIDIAEGEECTHTLVVNGADKISAYVTEGEAEYDAGSIYTSNVTFPEGSPADSADTTEGVHDPTIFHDPVGGKYWVYSTHNVVFESDDLINWIKHDYTKLLTVPEKSREFIEKNYENTEVNGTYWAPDILYVPSDAKHPYWFYLSVSCGLGGRNSVITLIKAASPSLWDGEYEDCGVMLASVENKEYNTNAIDANIYTDTDGKNYFVWGSFWRGIHAAELNDDGTVKGIDYKNDETILESSKQFGTRLFSTPGGVSGPEGPFMVTNEDTGYRYLFTSYGWLGTNYNIRIARAPLSETMEDILNGENPHWQFKDANDRMVGTTYADQGNLSELWGYKMIGSYKLGGGQEFLGNGHCSVLHDNDGNWYYVEHARKEADAIAYLQVHKMLWTPDGWPVVSPMVYAGEEVQDIPKGLICGTWDLASVGHTIMRDGVRDVSKGSTTDSDLPVHSCEITFMPDGKLAGNKGTWEFDGHNTVTLTFTKDGYTDLNEYYLAGDVMELYVMPGFDKEAQEKTLVMTGVDQNHIAQFAEKSGQSVADTYSEEIQTIPIPFNKSDGGNPILGFDGDGNLMYGGDPSALVVGDTVYIYVGHDTASNDTYVMPDWRCYSSKDMKRWNYEGIIMSASDISWAKDKTSAWAAQVAEHNGKYYFYYCTWANAETANGYQCIGVAVSDSPTGPFTDIGHPLINGETDTTENTSTWNDIDPTVLIDTDENGEEHIYLAWGNSQFYMCELNSDMVSVKKDTIKKQKIENFDGHYYTEAPWLYKRDGKYYLFYAVDWREQMAYATTDDITSGVWQFERIIMPPTATSNTNHPAVIDFKGNTYFIYHNGALPGGSGFRRVVNVEKLDFMPNMIMLDYPSAEDYEKLESRSDYKEIVNPIQERSVGLGGTEYLIKSADESLIFGYNASENTLSDDDYPMTKEIVASSGDTPSNVSRQWEITKGLYNCDNKYYVSIQAADEPGLYIKVTDDNEAVVTQDTDGLQSKKMTFKTVMGLSGEGISFESAAKPGRFLTWNGEKMVLSDGSDKKAATFAVSQSKTADSLMYYSVEETLTGSKITPLTLTGSKITPFNAEKGTLLYAVKYDDDGKLERVQVLTVEEDGETTLQLPFMPDMISFWTAGNKFLYKWKRN